MPHQDSDRRLQLEGWSLHQRMRQAQSLQGGSIDLEAWCSVVAPDQKANFSKRLDWAGLTPEQATWILNAELPAEIPPPSWWSIFEQLRVAAHQFTPFDILNTRGCRLAFVHVWRPVAAWALQSLQRRCHDLEPHLLITQDAWLDLAEGLLRRLCYVSEQALWELFNQRRTPGQILLAHLGTSADGSGEPVHEAYDLFVEELRATSLALLLDPYPVLARLLAVVTELWLDANEQMLRHLAASRSGLSEIFSIGADLPLAAIEAGLSDPHRGGRSVAILCFGECDNYRRVVYKPKDMQVDLVYQEFLGRLNKVSDLPPLRQVNVLSSPGYGFMEWVAHQPSESDEQLAVFYANAGRLMAVLHLLGCTDCHHENLIASGDQLVLIDTETLLEADLRDLVGANVDDPDLLSPLRTSMLGCVLRSGLLPQWLMVGVGRKRALDISALGIEPPPSEREQPCWLGLNTDGMIAGSSIQPCDLPTSLPVALGSAQRLTDFVDELCTGFQTQLREFIRIKAQLQEGLNAFRGKPRRLVTRATRLYFAIQRQMLEPSSLRSAISHGLKLEQLSRSFVIADAKPLNWRVFESEVLQMNRLDIPFFEHLIDETDLPLSDGMAPIKDFMRSSGLAAAKSRLTALDEPEINFQLALVRGAITARHLVSNSKTDMKTDHPPISLRAGSDSIQARHVETYAQEALKLATQVWNESVRDRSGRPEWLGMDLGSDGESFSYGLIGPSLYSGTSGIAVALARVAASQPECSSIAWRGRAWDAFSGLADMSLRNTNNQMFRLVRDMPYGMAGTGGLLLALDLIGQAGIVEACNLAHQLIDQLRPERLQDDKVIDALGGITGLIGPLLRSKHPRGLELAHICGERLVQLHQPEGGWSLINNKPPLTGFSHGAAGMAAALAKLAHASGQERFAAAAVRAVGYERSVYVPSQRNWPDFRSSKTPTDFMISWCHGSPGILLSRLVLRSCGLSDPQLTEELEIARASTVARLESICASGESPKAHLCCGVFGLTTLLRLDSLLSDIPLPEQVASSERYVVDIAEVHGDYNFFNLGMGSLNLPGLFTGKAGVILALQEAADGLRWLGPIMSAGLLD